MNARSIIESVAAGEPPAEYADLPTYLMTDQPPTCPQCSRRITQWLWPDNQDGPRQVVKCTPCNYTFKLEDDGDTEEDFLP